MDLMDWLQLGLLLAIATVITGIRWCIIDERAQDRAEKENEHE